MSKMEIEPSEFMKKLKEKTKHISFDGMSFCLAGKFDSPKEGTYMSIRGYRGKTVEAVSKKTTYLVVPDGEIDEENANVKKARSFGVKIIDKSELMKMMGLDEESLRDL